MWKYNIEADNFDSDDTYNADLNKDRKRKGKPWTWRMKTVEEVEKILKTQKSWKRIKNKKWKSWK